jgi:UDPglucose 6-dehydrogenase
MRVGIFGATSIGLSTAVEFANLGHSLTCIDKDPEKIYLLQNGGFPFYEPDLAHQLADCVAKGLISFTSSLPDTLAHLEVLFLTPHLEELHNECTDLRPLFQIAEEIAAYLETPLSIALKTPTPIGTAAQIEAIIAEKIRQRGLVPEARVAIIPAGEKTIVGLSSPDEERIYRKLFQSHLQSQQTQLLFSDLPTAELIAQSQHVLTSCKVNLINEITRLATRMDAQIPLLLQGLETSAEELTLPSTAEKNLNNLIAAAQKYNADLPLLTALKYANTQHHKTYAYKILDALAYRITNSAIAILGLANQAGSDEVSNSPASVIIDMLLAQGAQIFAHDPLSSAQFRRHYGEHEQVHYLTSLGSELREMAAIVLVTPWDTYKNIDWQGIRNSEKKQTIFDLRYHLDGTSLTTLGYEYYC